jgi:hypothetical protein
VVDQVLQSLGDGRTLSQQWLLLGNPGVEPVEDGLGQALTLLSVDDAGGAIRRRPVGVVKKPNETDSNQSALAIAR